jgi:hypothetical protein
MDLFVVPTIGFDLLYAFIIVRLGRRYLAWINVTTNPTAEWVARPITEAFPWDGVPGYMIRNRHRIYGTIVRRRLRAIGSIRRECLDHIFVLAEAPIYAESCDATRATTTTSERIGLLDKDSPLSRPVQRSGRIKIVSRPRRIPSHYARV